MAGTSAARVEANRRNAQKSTGPRTAEGKARSRQNAVKHGLTGRGIALRGEDAAAVEARFATLQEELRPSGLFGQLCIQQIALASVRVERAAREEAAVLEPKLRDAAAEFDRARLAEIDRLFATIEECPGDHRRRLLAQPEGVDQLIAALTGARDQLQSGVSRQWSAADERKVEALFGGTGGQFPATRTDALLVGLAGDDSYFPPEVAARLKTKDERAAWARAGLIEEIDAELARLAEARAAIDLGALDRDRQTAAARIPAADAQVDRLRKYGAAAARDFSRAYRDLRRAEADAPALDPNPPLADEPTAEAPSAPAVAANAPEAPVADEPNDAPPAPSPTPAGPRPAAPPQHEPKPTPARVGSGVPTHVPPPAYHPIR